MQSFLRSGSPLTATLPLPVGSRCTLALEQEGAGEVALGQEEEVATTSGQDDQESSTSCQLEHHLPVFPREQESEELQLQLVLETSGSEGATPPPGQVGELEDIIRESPVKESLSDIFNQVVEEMEVDTRRLSDLWPREEEEHATPVPAETLVTGSPAPARRKSKQGTGGDRSDAVQPGARMARKSGGDKIKSSVVAKQLVSATTENAGPSVEVRNPPEARTARDAVIEMLERSPHSLCCPRVSTFSGARRRRKSSRAASTDSPNSTSPMRSLTSSGRSSVSPAKTLPPPAPGSSSSQVLEADPSGSPDSLTTPRLPTLSPAASVASSSGFSAAVKAKAPESKAYRSLYTMTEERAVVDYLLRHGGYAQRGGNTVWRAMERQGVCSGRSWQSLKSRFDKHIVSNLAKLGVTKSELVAADKKREEAAQTRGGEDNPDYRASYSRQEDQAIVAFIAGNRRYGDVGGRELWKLMEERGVVKGRSWQSLKERFRKTILKKIRSYELTGEQLRGFTGSREGPKQRRMVDRRPETD